MSVRRNNYHFHLHYKLHNNTQEIAFEDEIRDGFYECRVCNLISAVTRGGLTNCACLLSSHPSGKLILSRLQSKRSRKGIQKGSFLYFTLFLYIVWYSILVLAYNLLFISRGDPTNCANSWYFHIRQGSSFFSIFIISNFTINNSILFISLLCFAFCFVLYYFVIEF